MGNNVACTSCKYGEFATHNEWGDKIIAKFGRCRRYPPQTFSKATGYAEFNFPRVDKNDWCGEWKEGAEMGKEA
jgi:hypothetical protein